MMRNQLCGQVKSLKAQYLAMHGLLMMILAMALIILSARSHANDLMDIPSSFKLAGLSQNFNALAPTAPLMGSNEKRSDNLKPFTKWSGVLARFNAMANRGADKTLLQNWHAELARFSDYELADMAEAVNNKMNAQPYILDSQNWGQSDYWATPIEFMRRGGDCEDFAIAKYAALRALGVPESRLRLAIVQDTWKDIPHAILIVYTNRGAYILDNQVDDMVNASTNTRYRPIYSINRQAWWLHTSGKTTIASAR